MNLVTIEKLQARKSGATASRALLVACLVSVGFATGCPFGETVVVPSAGPAGPAGATGASGATGDTGKSGASGATGDAGATGATGAQGDAGAKGAPGGGTTVVVTPAPTRR